MIDATRNIEAERYRVRGYRLLRPLARGGLAQTWLAETLEDSRLVAVKELHLSTRSQTREIELFERECRTLSALDHPQIPRFIETIVERRDHELVLFLVQEYVDGPSLLQLLRAGFTFEPRDVVAVMRSCLRPLAYLHSQNPAIFHRDLKPGNILVRPDGECVLIDFGAVRNEGAMPASQNASVVGTFGYMAPEQFQAHAVAGTDLYGLGATALHLLTNREPVRFELVRLKPDIMPHVGHAPALGRILDRLLEPTPEDRHLDAPALEAELIAWCASHAPDDPMGLPSGRVAQHRLLVELEAYRQQEPGRAPGAEDFGPRATNPSLRTAGSSSEALESTTPVGESSGPNPIFSDRGHSSGPWSDAHNQVSDGRSARPRRFERTPASGNHDTAEGSVRLVNQQDAAGFLVNMPGLTEAPDRRSDSGPMQAARAPHRRTDPGLQSVRNESGEGPAAPSRRTSPGLIEATAAAPHGLPDQPGPPSRGTNPGLRDLLDAEAPHGLPEQSRPPSRGTNPGLQGVLDAEAPHGLPEQSRPPSRGTNPGLRDLLDAEAPHGLPEQSRPPSRGTDPGLQGVQDALLEAEETGPTPEWQPPRSQSLQGEVEVAAAPEAQLTGRPTQWSEEQVTLPRVSLEEAIESDLPEIWARPGSSIEDVELPPARIGMKRGGPGGAEAPQSLADNGLPGDNPSTAWTGPSPIVHLPQDGEDLPDDPDATLPPEPVRAMQSPIPPVEHRGLIGGTTMEVPAAADRDDLDVAVTGEHRRVDPSRASGSRAVADAQTSDETDAAFDSVLTSSGPQVPVAATGAMPSPSSDPAPADPTTPVDETASSPAAPESAEASLDPPDTEPVPTPDVGTQRPDLVGRQEMQTGAHNPFSGSRRTSIRRRTITLTLKDPKVEPPEEAGQEKAATDKTDAEQVEQVKQVEHLTPVATSASGAWARAERKSSEEDEVTDEDVSGAWSRASGAHPATAREQALPSGTSAAEAALARGTHSALSGQQEAVQRAKRLPASPSGSFEAMRREQIASAPTADAPVISAPDTEKTPAAKAAQSAPDTEKTPAAKAAQSAPDTEKTPAARATAREAAVKSRGPAEGRHEASRASGLIDDSADTQRSEAISPRRATPALTADGPAVRPPSGWPSQVSSSGPTTDVPATTADVPAARVEDDNVPLADRPTIRTQARSADFGPVDDPSGAFAAFDMLDPSNVVRRRIRAGWTEPFIPGGQSATMMGLWFELLGVALALGSVWLSAGAVPRTIVGVGAVFLLYGILLTLVPRRGASKTPGRRIPSAIAPEHQVTAVERRLCWTGSVEWWAEYAFETPEQWASTGRIRLKSGSTARILFHTPERTRVRYGIDDPDGVSTLLLDTTGPPLKKAGKGRGRDA